ncbi:hypothetical protein N7470_004422 [Penicillium chermesinum]|nr:hypothetical protein N7470_004422 [Penicillium chermesinum]
MTLGPDESIYAVLCPNGGCNLEAEIWERDPTHVGPSGEKAQQERVLGYIERLRQESERQDCSAGGVAERPRAQGWLFGATDAFNSTSRGRVSGPQMKCLGRWRQ